MAKAAIVKITKDLLQDVLGLYLHNIEIQYAQISHKYWKAEYLELVISGESLPDEFAVEDGERVKNGTITVHHKEIETEIKLSRTQSD